MSTNYPRFLAAIFAVIFSLGAPLHAAVTNYVTTTADSGPGSLRQAIANSLSGDVIKFLTEGVITLTSGELSITNNLTIIGPGAFFLAISGNNASRVFNISGSATTSISGLTIRDGRTTNGTMSGRMQEGGTGGGQGGGVYNKGTLYMSDCFITGNATGSGGEGAFGGNGKDPGRIGGDGGNGGMGGPGGDGAGIYNSGVLKVRACTFLRNFTGSGGGGGFPGAGGQGNPFPGRVGIPGSGGIGGRGAAIWNERGVLTVIASTFESNLCGDGGMGARRLDGAGGPGAPGRGGSGVGIGNNGTSTVSACTFIMNVAGRGGSGHPSYPRNDLPPTSGGDGGNGGGIFNEHAFIVSNCTFVGNTGGPGGIAGTGAQDGSGGSGGAIYNGGTLTTSDCTLSGNLGGLTQGFISGNGGAICNIGSLTMVASAFTGNSVGGDGGAIYNTGTLDALACTLSGNSCAYGSSVVQGGGAIWSRTSGEVTLTACTVVSNHAFSGGGILNYLGSTRCIIRSTLIAGNVSGSANRDLFGAFESRGHNLVGTGGSRLINTVNGDLVGDLVAPINPLLGPLQDNGGPVFTHALLAGSPAIDAGTNGGAAFDARGQPRTIDNSAVTNASGGDGTDIGALEVNHVLTGTEVRKTGNDVRVRFTSVSDKIYGVEYRPEVGGGPWTGLPGTVAGTGGVATYTDVNSASLPRRFYRIFEQAP